MNVQRDVVAREPFRVELYQQKCVVEMIVQLQLHRRVIERQLRSVTDLLLTKLNYFQLNEVLTELSQSIARVRFVPMACTVLLKRGHEVNHLV